VAVFDLQNKNAVPTFKSDAKSGKHGDPVWQVSWQKDNLDENLNFASVSSDGCVRQWVLLTNELVYTDLIKLVSPTSAIEEPEKNLNLAGAYCIDFHKKQEDIFVVGTEEGSIFACSKQYNSQALLSFEVFIEN
jgi:dynein intermediate chain 1